MTPLKVGIAGTTAHTVLCADAIFRDPAFAVQWVLTPEPKPIGRKQVITKNPLQLWAEAQQVQVFSIQQKIDQSIKEKLLNTNIDLLLVVDFGYLVPGWLLKLPRIGPVNIHPSALPRWRGSSPGQFVLLYGETDSAITVMEMAAGMDTGPIIVQVPLKVESSWQATTYYQVAFEYIAAQLSSILQGYAAQPTNVTQQPAESPTLTARRLNREDGFVSWNLIQAVMHGQTPDANAIKETSALLQETQQLTGHSWDVVIQHAVSGFSPWPGLWTYLPTENGQKRLKILAVSSIEPQKISLETIQLEGENPKAYSAFLK